MVGEQDPTYYEPQPELMIFDEADIDQREALQDFVAVAVGLGSEELTTGLELYDSNPAASTAIVRYLHNCPEGGKIISAWAKIRDTEADKVVLFDPRTELALQNNPAHTELIERFRNRKGDAERAAVRRSRFVEFILRFGDRSEPTSTDSAA